MRITVLGAAGNVGSRVVSEALSRGHEVAAVVRNPAGLNELPAAASARGYKRNLVANFRWHGESAAGLHRLGSGCS